MNKVTLIKRQLRETLVQGIAETIRSFKEAIHDDSSKYSSLILLESRLKDIEEKNTHGTISEELLQLEHNKIREALIKLVNILNQSDIDGKEALQEEALPTVKVVKEAPNKKPEVPASKQINKTIKKEAIKATVPLVHPQEPLHISLKEKSGKSRLFNVSNSEASIQLEIKNRVRNLGSNIIEISSNNQIIKSAPIGYLNEFSGRHAESFEFKVGRSNYIGKVELKFRMMSNSFKSFVLFINQSIVYKD